ncbi:hypothetical protein GE061_003621 [Apolygus lucorum]|uniref:Uncharacterized protein n=1 Tax=Apolygus lucorum TaxID=248454 RepID=A0A8S9X2M5_APOLU|nr:hypothetical protein GE061_003621 [Apolygus lucorum]
MAQLFELYKLKCQEVSIKPMSRFVFDKKCKANKLSIYTPRKDRCDTCIQFEINKTLSKEAFDAHRAMKDMARAEKENDKNLAKQGLIHVICCDVMKVTLLPITDASSSYYKMKLAMHNFTVYNLANHEAVCYWFCETEANLVASTFASCLVSFLNDLLDTGLKDVTIYSDGCPYQNRNNVLSNALLHFSMERNIVINQKYLEKGHTQMEGDSVHSTIEHVLNKTKVYLPYELLQITERARKEPPYKAKLLSYDFFKNYAANFIYDSIRPGNKPSDPVVNDIRQIQYDPKGVIRYRLNFETPLQELPRRPKKPSSHSFKKLYTNRLPITRDKYEDLKSMQKYIPDEAFLYYKTLPHVEESYRKKKAQLKSSTTKRDS